MTQDTRLPRASGPTHRHGGDQLPEAPVQPQQEPTLHSQPGQQQEQQEAHAQPGSAAGPSSGAAPQPRERDVRLSVHHEHGGPHHHLFHACADEAPRCPGCTARLGPARCGETTIAQHFSALHTEDRRPRAPGLPSALGFGPAPFPLALLFFLSHPPPGPMSLSLTVSHTFQRPLKM